MPEKKLIMFDFDGVLVDTLLMCHGIHCEIHGSKSLDEYKALFTGNIFKTFKDKKLAVVPTEKFGEVYAEKSREIAIPEILKKLVRDLSKKNTLVIVSSTTSSAITGILVREGVSDVFADVLGCDVDYNKAVKIKSLLEKYAVSPKDAVFITDTSGDVHEGMECGISSIAVTWGFQTKETLMEAKPAVIVEKPEDLGPSIERFFSATI